MKEFLSANEIKFVYMDITESMLNLKMFLKYRDTRPEFQKIKEEGRVGLPCIIVNNGEYILFEEPSLELIKD